MSLVCKTSAVFVNVDESGHKLNISEEIKKDILSYINDPLKYSIPL